jgi:uncharacterized membrane protein (DUF485 family)
MQAVWQGYTSPASQSQNQGMGELMNRKFFLVWLSYMAFLGAAIGFVLALAGFLAWAVNYFGTVVVLCILMGFFMVVVTGAWAYETVNES